MKAPEKKPRHRGLKLGARPFPHKPAGRAPCRRFHGCVHAIAGAGQSTGHAR